MVRTVFEPDRRARFERIQHDDREHAEWILDADVGEQRAAGSVLHDASRVHAASCGARAMLGRILDDEVRRGIGRAVAVFSEPTPTR